MRKVKPVVCEGQVRLPFEEEWGRGAVPAPPAMPAWFARMYETEHRLMMGSFSNMAFYEGKQWLNITNPRQCVVIDNIGTPSRTSGS
jgi:hypothetical protein